MSVSRIRLTAGFAALGVVAATVGAGVGAASATTDPDPERTATADPVHSASAPSGPLTSTLKGRARMDYPDPGHDIQVTVDARATFKGVGWSKPEEASGTFRIHHRMPGTGAGPDKVNWGTSRSTASPPVAPPPPSPGASYAPGATSVPGTTI
ncbi:hypothetical protein [Streptomyces sp. NPDC003032]